MKRIYRGFKTECPTGLITEEVFHSIYARFFPNGGARILEVFMKSFLENDKALYFIQLTFCGKIYKEKLEVL